MTRSRAKRRPQTRVVVGLVFHDHRRADHVLHLLPAEPRALELDATEAELAEDTIAIATDGERGRWLGTLNPRALCGERICVGSSVGEEKLAADRKCDGCFGNRPKGS